MEYLPREIILDILSRLPVTSLLQSKLVCKAWKSLVKDPLLVCMHFSHANKSDPCLILHCDKQLYSLEFSDHCKDGQRVKKIRIPVLPKFYVVGSCKGLLCLCDSSTKKSLYVSNPFSRDYIELPKSTELLHQGLVGFGFNKTTNKYKVINVVTQLRGGLGGRNRRTEFMSFQPEVQILNVGSPAWRNIGKLPYNLIYQAPSQVLVCGRIHWKSWLPRSEFLSGELIISFDFEDEQFREVPKPDCGGLDDSLNFELVDLEGSFSAMVSKYFDGQFEIWIMKEYNVKESWIKEFNIGSHVPRSLEEANRDFKDLKLYQKGSYNCVLGLLKTGEVLLMYNSRHLVTYDLKDGTFNHLTFPGIPYWFEAVVHEGSLNWIDTLVNDS